MDSEGEWFAREEFWEWSFPMMFPASRFEQAETEVAQLRALAGMDEGRVLDLGCGPGRHAIPFARQGFAVTGVDRSSFLLTHARTYSTEEGVDVEWIEEDMRAFRRPESYDLAISIFTSFGYFDLPEDNARVLENVHASLAPNGKLVIHVLGKETLARRFLETETKELDGLGVLFQHRTVFDDWTRLKAEWTLVRGESAQRFGFRVWIYSGSELRQMLRHAGFTTVQLYGDLDGSPYDLNARRLVAVAGK